MTLLRDESPPTAPPAAPDTLAAENSTIPEIRWTGPRLAAVAALIIGYAGLSHYSSSVPDARGLGAALSVGPLLLIGAILLWRWTRPLIALLVAACLGVLLYRYWGFLERNFEVADLLQQCGAYGLVSLSFARTLMSGRVPLCTQMAQQLHSSLAPVELAYLRRATVAWAAFYALIAAAVVILFFAVSKQAWSFFVNFTAFGLIIIACLADYALRHFVLPRRSDSIFAMLRRSLIG
jgi:uncharacterized membrane protein